MHQFKQQLLRQLPLILATFIVAGATTTTSAYSARPDATFASDTSPTVTDSMVRVALYDRDTLDGLSGKLWMKLMSHRPADSTSVLARLFGDSAVRTPGVYVARDSMHSSSFMFVNLVPFAAKKNGVIGDYRMGTWPKERRDIYVGKYDNPAGFIQVTQQNQDHRVSEHFRLGDFLTKDQHSVWPKYLVLQEKLVDKLELVIGALNRQGVRASKMQVMSGFRTPQYNDRGVGAGGRSEVSRHQYGDAADVFIDSDYNGGMDDLNGDGVVNTRDAHFLAQVAEKVERDHPGLIGGIGVYPATSAHGPFVHIDVRGTKARW